MLKDIFKESIWATSYTTDLNSYVETHLKKDPVGRKVSNHGGYQSEDLDLTDSSISPLVTYIEKQAFAYGKKLDYHVKKYWVSNMWINVNGYKDYNDTHIHPYCIFAGVYFINVTPEQGELCLTRHDIYQKELSFANYEKLNPYNWSNYKIKPNNHMCILFPANLPHSVRPNLTNNKRVSLSFNIQGTV